MVGTDVALNKYSFRFLPRVAHNLLDLCRSQNTHPHFTRLINAKQKRSFLANGCQGLMGELRLDAKTAILNGSNICILAIQINLMHSRWT